MKRPTLKKNEIIRLKASNLANPTAKLLVNLKLTRYTRLLVMSNLFGNKSVRYNLDFSKMDFPSHTTAYKIEDADYIGTVGSTITDISMDIYYVNKTVDENGTNVNYGFFVAFPTLFLLPDIDIGTTRSVDLDAVVFGVEDGSTVKMTGSVVEIGEKDELTLYLKNQTLLTPNKLSNKLITFPGIDSDSLYNTTEVYTTPGQCNGDDVQPTQYISLGTMTDLFSGYDPLVGLKLHIGTIDQVFHNQYKISKAIEGTIKNGTLCIPLNF